MFIELLLAGLSLQFLPSLVGAQLTERTMTFVNQCKNNVYVVPNSGATNALCSKGCPAGTTCGGNGTLCFFDNPAPNTASYWVNASGGTMQIVYPAVPNAVNQTAWDGNYQFCPLAQGCGSDAGPYSQVEFFLSQNATTPDAYDSTLIAGISFPFSVTPEVVDSTNSQSSNPYLCGDPGSPKPSTPGLGASSWDFTYPNSESWYQWVLPPVWTNPQNCSNGCPSNQTCGTIYEVATTSFKEVCGYLSGYWTAEQICALNPATTTPYDCQASVTNDYIQTTCAGLQSCTGTSGTCYPPSKHTADEACCGCANWASILAPGSVPAITTSCNNSSPAWNTTVFPTIDWLKKGCPNCYLYQFDDPSSSFTCIKNHTGYNTQNYTITFCPDEVSIGLGFTPSLGPWCNGRQYNNASQVCDNGQICPTGQYYCGGQCYDPASECCSAGARSSYTSSCTCGSAVFGKGDVCDFGQLCATGEYNCGGNCYSPSSYNCCNGALTLVGQGC